MRIVMSSGHGKKIRGASGYIDEVDEARRVVNRVAEMLTGTEATITVFHDDISTSQNENLNRIVNFHNSKSRDLDVSVHFNAYQTTSKGMGTECLYVTQDVLADKMAQAISAAAGLIDRGPKKRTDLFFLNNTDEPAILIEVCFVDSKEDSDFYKADFEEVCRAIAETVSGIVLQPDEPEEPVEPPEPVPPADVRIGTVTGVAAGDALNIRAAPSNSGTIIGLADNGDELNVVGQSVDGWYRIVLTSGAGEPETAAWVSARYVLLEEGEPLEGEWHTNITATVFSGSGDPQNSAYPPHGPINGSKPGASVPYKWRDGPPPTLEIAGPSGTDLAPTVDVGPWNTDDPAYVLDGHRPLAEEQYEERLTAQNGQVPTNNAGIDLTPATAEAVGISGKGKVSWRIVS